ncbi:transposase [Streptomyces sp. NPDC055681]
MEGTLFFHVVRTGCGWRLPKDFAPWPTVYWYFVWWHDDGTVERLHDALREQVRVADGRSVEPSVGLIDKAPDQRGFQVQPKRWAVERTCAW